MALSDWLIWWRAEIREWVRPVWLPAWLKRRQSRLFLSDGALVLKRGDKTVALSEPVGGRDQIGEYGLSPRTELAFSAEDGLERVVAPLRLPKSTATRMALLDLSTSTPIRPDEVCLLHSSCVGSKASTSYFAIKRSKIAAILDALGTSRTRIATVVADGATASHRADLGLMKQLSLVAWQQRFQRALFTFGSIFLLLAGFATLGHLYWRDSQALAAVDAQIVDARSKVSDIRRANMVRKERIEKIQALRHARDERVPVVAIWEELTRVVPDSAWVNELIVSEGTVKFSGFAKAASSLIAGLDASAMFKEPGFVGQIVRDPQSGKERFSITMQLEGS